MSDRNRGTAVVKPGALRLPLGIALEPTENMKAGLSYVTQCAGCGLLAAVVGGLGDDPAPRKLGACPACGRGEWWRQDLDVGPFRRRAA
jgi:hypothetical protein